MDFGQCDPQKPHPCAKPGRMSRQLRKSVQRDGLGAIGRDNKWTKNAHLAYISPQRGGAWVN